MQPTSGEFMGLAWDFIKPGYQSNEFMDYGTMINGRDRAAGVVVE